MGNCGSSPNADVDRAAASSNPPPAAAAKYEVAVEKADVNAQSPKAEIVAKPANGDAAQTGKVGQNKSAGQLKDDAKRPVTDVPEAAVEEEESQGMQVHDVLLQVSSLIQKISDGQTEKKTPTQILKRCIDLVVADCQAKFACIQVVSVDSQHALHVTTSGAGNFIKDEHRFQQLNKKGAPVAASKVIASKAEFYEWKGDTEPEVVDWKHLAESLQLKALYAVPLKVKGQAIGILTLGFTDRVGTHSHEVWPTYLKLIGANMTSRIKDTCIPKYMDMVQDLYEAPDLDSFVHYILTHFRAVLTHQNSTHTWFRIALAADKAAVPAGTIFDDVTQLNSATGAGSKKSSGGSIGLSESHKMLSEVQAAGGIMRSYAPLKGSIMKVSIQNRQQVIIPDLQKLLNQSGRVSHDLFNNRLFKPPTSVLVFPLRVKQNVYGALYCMSSVRSDFADINMRLREASDTSSPHILHLLNTKLKDEYEPIKMGANAPGNISASGNMTGGSGIFQSGMLGSGVYTGSVSMGSDFGSTMSKGDVSSYATQARSFTGALVSGLTEKLNEKRIRSAMEFGVVPLVQDLQIKHPLDEGGFAKVFRGLYRGLVVGIKVVCDDGKNEKMDMKNAHEIAILSTVSHPNVIQAYVCMTDVPVYDLISVSMANASPQVLNSPAYKYLQSNSDKVCHIEVLEYCDLGNLSTAVQRHVFFMDSPGQGRNSVRSNLSRSGQTDELSPLKEKDKDKNEGGRLVNMRHLLITLIEIASALAEMHRMGIVHCDIKPPNVLLKSSNTDPRGFIAKVSDFGLSRVEDDETAAYFPFNSCGTVPYVAPEALTNSKKVNSSVDVYAYGIMMWEIYTAKKPFSKMKQQDLVDQVVRNGLRPIFPTNAPEDYAKLAESCWSAAPESRPTFVECTAQLNRMMDAQLAVAQQNDGPGSHRWSDMMGNGGARSSQSNTGESPVKAHARSSVPAQVRSTGPTHVRSSVPATPPTGNR